MRSHRGRRAGSRRWGGEGLEFVALQQQGGEERVGGVAERQDGPVHGVVVQVGPVVLDLRGVLSVGAAAGHLRLGGEAGGQCLFDAVGGGRFRHDADDVDGLVVQAGRAAQADTVQRDRAGRGRRDDGGGGDVAEAVRHGGVRGVVGQRALPAQDGFELVGGGGGGRRGAGDHDLVELVGQAADDRAGQVDFGSGGEGEPFVAAHGAWLGAEGGQFRPYGLRVDVAVVPERLLRRLADRDRAGGGLGGHAGGLGQGLVGGAEGAEAGDRRERPAAGVAAEVTPPARFAVLEVFGGGPFSGDGGQRVSQPALARLLHAPGQDEPGGQHHTRFPHEPERRE